MTINFPSNILKRLIQADILTAKSNLSILVKNGVKNWVHNFIKIVYKYCFNKTIFEQFMQKRLINSFQCILSCFSFEFFWLKNVGEVLLYCFGH